ncbi:Smr/MutS family protein [Chelativorans salis]|uniref:Smr/MutS family protein n=1 Tax=Chelativorans salis TaxID=2978478 RepID=A0ABT2LPJ8_9HYPH|nr:Smr/MutS family protein [Chelativorans sp. EGI FJ00035]MCT7376231.1 Smr/MutS family protein [Chelativorans sp. EGI FJ00035]
MKRKFLTPEDRILWSRVARTAVPMKGKSFPDAGLEPPPTTPAGKRKRLLAPAAVPGADVSARPARHPRKLDEPTREKLAKGRLDIGGRVDLHGMTQEEAHILLLSFLRRAYEADRRYVLVITGKGTSGEGVLRRAVPQWLATPPFRAIVGGYEEAARHHGGGGALYVRLRRRGGGR